MNTRTAQQMSNCSLILCLLIFKLVVPCYCKILINKLTVPPMALNGTSEQIVLDCDFSYDSEDQLLVVKWFHDNDATPIYQFLSEIKSTTVSDKWKDMVLLDKEPDTDDINVWNQIFRKLKFRYVTISMSGRYTCLVESIQSQASKTEKMVVYAPPKISSFNFERIGDRMPSALTRAGPNIRATVNNNKLMAGYYGGRAQQQQQALQQQMYQQNSNQNGRLAPQQQQYQKHQQYQNRKPPSSFNENNMDAILTCQIDSVYPMPEVVIFRRDFNGTNPYALKIFQIEQNTTKNSAINLRVRSAVNDNELRSRFGSTAPSVFECRVTVTINQENIQRTKQLLYYPSFYEANKQQVAQGGYNSGSSSIIVFNGWIMFMLFVWVKLNQMYSFN